MLYFLLSGMQTAMSIRNEYLDTQLKKMEFQLKEIELYDKLQERKELEGIKVEKQF